MRVCVVGGGPAGLGLAYYLEQAGYHDVVVFEKSAVVGGKCLTLVRDGLAYDLGAVELTNNYVAFNALVDAFQCARATVPSGVLIDGTTGATSPVSSLFAGVPMAVLAEQVANFFAAQELLSGYLDQPGFAGMPEALKGVTFTQWLNSIGAPLIERFFWMPITCYGYGDLSRMPAVYALKFITVMPFHVHALRHGLRDLLPAHLRDVLPPYLHRLELGMQDLMNRIAASLTRPPVTGATIERVTRSADGVLVEYRVGDEPTVRRDSFDRIVLALPQTLENLSFMDLDAEEQALFEPVKTIHYYTSFTRPRALDYRLYFELVDEAAGRLGPPAPPRVLEFVRSWESAPGAVFYSYSAPDVELPLDGATGSVEALVDDALAAAGQTRSGAVESAAWKYFPQVPQASIDAGFYDELERRQGLKRTYYTGGLLNFELLEKVVQYSQSVVDRFFPKPPAAG